MLVTDRWSGHIWDFYLQDRKADTIILKILFDVIFNEQETFNGDLEALKDDMLHVRLDELSKSLQQYAIPEELEEKQVQPAQEEFEEVRELGEDELYVQSETETGPEEKQSNTGTCVGPYPTPLPSPRSTSDTGSINPFSTW